MSIRRVEAIRDLRKVVAIKKLLRGQEDPRDYLLFIMGINIALPISELLLLIVGDVLDKRGEIGHSINIYKPQVGKASRIHLNVSVREALAYYFSKNPATESETPLFRSKRSNQPIDRTRAWRLINNWCQAVGLNHDRYGGQTLRKTWGYLAHKVHGVPIKLIQARLGHSSAAETKRYLGIKDEEIMSIEQQVLL